jgi:hypothetical protein
MANVKDVVSTNADLVNYLLVNKFHTLSYDDKIFVKKYNQNSVPETGSQVRNKLFCWLCTLFGK